MIVASRFMTKLIWDILWWKFIKGFTFSDIFNTYDESQTGDPSWTTCSLWLRICIIVGLTHAYCTGDSLPLPYQCNWLSEILGLSSCEQNTPIGMKQVHFLCVQFYALLLLLIYEWCKLCVFEIKPIIQPTEQMLDVKIWSFQDV